MSTKTDLEAFAAQCRAAMLDGQPRPSLPEALDADLIRASLWGANLKDANLERANLNGADLIRANLTDANLTRANLWGASLVRANLTGANLKDANLTRANLWGASLECANLRGASLTGANLVRANLVRANLVRASLECANLRGADFGLTIPTIPKIDAAILAAIEAGGELAMDKWHTCETTHCRAGWAITLAGEAGKALEERTTSFLAGALIYRDSRPGEPYPDFSAKDEDAMADIRACAARQTEEAP